MDPSASRPGTGPDDEERRRRRVNLIAAAGLLVFFLIAWGTVRLFVDHEDIQRCVDSGRRNCGGVDVAPREGVRVLTR